MKMETYKTKDENLLFVFKYNSSEEFDINDYELDKIQYVSGFSDNLGKYDDTIRTSTITWVEEIKLGLIPYTIVAGEKSYIDGKTFWKVVYDKVKHRKLKIEKILKDE